MWISVTFFKRIRTLLRLELFQSFLNFKLISSNITTMTVMIDYLTLLQPMYLFARVVVKFDVELESVVRPRSELHLADLDVEGKVADVDGTGGAEDGWRNPGDAATRSDDGHRVTVLLQACVRTAVHSSPTSGTTYHHMPRSSRVAARHGRYNTAH